MSQTAITLQVHSSPRDPHQSSHIRAEEAMVVEPAAPELCGSDIHMGNWLLLARKYLKSRPGQGTGYNEQPKKTLNTSINCRIVTIGLCPTSRPAQSCFSPPLQFLFLEKHAFLPVLLRLSFGKRADMR